MSASDLLNFRVACHYCWYLDQYTLVADTWRDSYLLLLGFRDALDPCKYSSGWSWYEDLKKRYYVCGLYDKSAVRRVYAFI